MPPKLSAATTGPAVTAGATESNEEASTANTRIDRPEALQPPLDGPAGNISANRQDAHTPRAKPQTDGDRRIHGKLLTHSTSDRDTHQRPLDFGLIVRIMQFTRPHALKRNWLLLLVILRSIQLPALTFVIAAVINGPIQRGDGAGVVWGAVGFAALMLSTQIVLHYRQRFALELGESVVHDLRNAVFAHLQRMPMSFFHRTKVGRIISRMTSDIEDVRVGVQEVLFVSTVQFGHMVVATVVMLWYDWQLFLVVLGLAPVLWWINRHFHRVLSVRLREMRDSYSRITATLAESVLGIRVTQGFVRQDENARLFHDLAADHSSKNFAVMRTHGLFLPLLELNNQVFIAALMVLGGFQVLRPESTTDVGSLVGFLLMSTMFFSPIANLGTQYNQALTAMAGAERLFHLLDTPPEWSDREDVPPAKSLVGRVEFRDLSFGYDPLHASENRHGHRATRDESKADGGERIGEKRLVLHHVNFTVEPGQTMALVGHTGSGKSSIINLISKFYLPTHGELFIDGREVRDWETAGLRRQLGIVLQQNFLFFGSVADNLRFAKPDATDEELMEAARKLDLLDFVQSLPQGLATPAGERGSQLSLGQRQLICFIRAMLMDPKILILDEATSSVDTLTEARIQRALALLVRGRTSFIVAHRLSTIRHADQVVVLDHGRIIEHGTHDELVAQGGCYAALYEEFRRAA